MPRLVFKLRDMTEPQCKALELAEANLLGAGVTFDTGTDGDGDGPILRYWELDWSLEGAEVVEVNWDNRQPIELRL